MGNGRWSHRKDETCLGEETTQSWALEMHWEDAVMLETEKQSSLILGVYSMPRRYPWVCSPLPPQTMCSAIRERVSVMTSTSGEDGSPSGGAVRPSAGRETSASYRVKKTLSQCSHQDGPHHYPHLIQATLLLNSSVLEHAGVQPPKLCSPICVQ